MHNCNDHDFSWNYSHKCWNLLRIKFKQFKEGKNSRFNFLVSSKIIKKVNESVTAAAIKPSLVTLKNSSKLNKKAAKNRQKFRQNQKKKQLAKLSDGVLKSKTPQPTKNTLSANQTLLANATLETKKASSTTKRILSTTTDLCKFFNSSSLG